MDYRSPVASLQRELETLEAELAALRAMPAPKPKPPPPLSKKAKKAAERERRALQSQLAKLENRMNAAGLRPVTVGEAMLDIHRFSLGCIVVGALVFCMHLALASESRSVWIEKSCTIEMDEGVLVASYEADGRRHHFLPKGHDLPEKTRCFVPGPAVIENVGRLERPPAAAVGLYEKLSFGWILAATLISLLGVVVTVISHLDRKRA